MKNFHLVTIFPRIFESYFSESIIKRAQKKGLVNISTYDLRDWTKDKHRTVDDTPYGGGAGMVLKVEPIWDCLQVLGKKIKQFSNKKKTRIILFSAKGKTFSQSDVRRLAKYENLVLLCGRYEGVDERVAKYLVDEEISIGEYVLTGGEIPALVVVDSIARLIPGVLGNAESAQQESHKKSGFREHPHYTKPEKFRDWKVPSVLLGGNHKKIQEWREKNSIDLSKTPK